MPRVIRFEIHASDPEAIASFFKDLFGWTFEKYDGPMEYWMLRTGPSDEPGIDGGLLRRPGPVPAGGQPVNSFICTVDVASAEASLARAVELGASVALPVMAVPGIGYVCYAIDPGGNLFGMMQSDPAAA